MEADPCGPTQDAPVALVAIAPLSSHFGWTVEVLRGLPVTT